MMTKFYRQYMSGIDICDQKISYDSNLHRAPNWTISVYHHKRDVILNNCFIAHQQLPNSKKMSSTNFRLEIAKSLMKYTETTTLKRNIDDSCAEAILERIDCNNSNKKKLCAECKESQRLYQCSKCKRGYCSDSKSFDDTCFQLHIKKQLKGIYNI